MDDVEVRRLMKAYDLRSGAAHGDVIEGQSWLGPHRAAVGMFHTSPEWLLVGKVWRVKEVARRVLSAALAGALPAV
jgi:hypothetical protein